MLASALGLKYEGEQSAGMMHGKGVLRNVDAKCGDGSDDYTFSRQNDFWFYRYEGEFAKDKLHGKGVRLSDRTVSIDYHLTRVPP